MKNCDNCKRLEEINTRLYEACKELNEQLFGANIPFSQKLFDAKKKVRRAIDEVEKK